MTIQTEKNKREFNYRFRQCIASGMKYPDAIKEAKRLVKILN